MGHNVHGENDAASGTRSTDNIQQAASATSSTQQEEISAAASKDELKENSSIQLDGRQQASATSQTVLSENKSNNTQSQEEMAETVSSDSKIETESIVGLSTSLSECQLLAGNDEDTNGDDIINPPALASKESKTTFNSLSDVQQELKKFRFVRPGSMSTGGSADFLPSNPGIKVHHVGTVSIPIPDEHVRAIVANADKISALHCNNDGDGRTNGISNEGRVGTNYPDTSELNIDSSQIHIRNPEWKSCLKKLVVKVATDLGIPNPSEVTSRLSHWKIYSEGCGNCSFLGDSPLNDDDYIYDEDPVATLIVQLPSRYTGGRIQVRHDENNVSQSFDFNPNAEFDCHYVAHLDDCSAQMTNIKSGRRQTLIYRLYCRTVIDGEVVLPSATAQFRSRRRLRQLLQNLAPEYRRFVLPLRQIYSPTESIVLSHANLNLIMRSLKGADQNQVLAILYAINSEQVPPWKFAIVSTPQSNPSGHQDGEKKVILRKEGATDLSWLDFVDVADLTTPLEDDGWTMAKGRTSGTVNEPCMLVLWSPDCELEILCDSNLTGAIGHYGSSETSTTQSEQPWDRILTFLTREDKELFWEAFCSLGSRSLLHPSIVRPCSKSRVAMLFSLVTSDIPPPPEGIAFILSTLAASTWSTQRLIIKMLNDRILLPGKKPFSSLLSFLQRFELANAIKPFCSELAFELMLSNMVSVFKDSTPKAIITKKPRTRSSVQELKSCLLRILSKYPSGTVRAAIASCVDAVLALKPQNDEVLFAVVDLVRELTATLPSDEAIGGWTKLIIDHFIKEVESPSYSKRRSLLLDNEIQSFIVFFVENASDEQMARVSQWAWNGPKKEINSLCDVLTAASSSFNTKEDKVKNWVASISQIAKKRTSEVLVPDRSRKRSTRSTSPKSVPLDLPEEIRNFLDGGDQGPMHYKHGKGYKTSRDLEQLSGSDYKIEAGSGFADEASVVVTRIVKTRPKRLRNTTTAQADQPSQRTPVDSYDKGAPNETSIKIKKTIPSVSAAPSVGAIQKDVAEHVTQAIKPAAKTHKPAGESVQTTVLSQKRYAIPESNIHSRLPKPIRDFLGSNFLGPMTYKHGKGIAISNQVASLTGRGYTIESSMGSGASSSVIVRKNVEALTQAQSSTNEGKGPAVGNQPHDFANPSPTQSDKLKVAPGTRGEVPTTNAARVGQFDYDVTFLPGSFGLRLDEDFQVQEMIPTGQAVQNNAPIQQGDVLVRLNGQPITSWEQFFVDSDKPRIATFRRTITKDGSATSKKRPSDAKPSTGSDGPDAAVQDGRPSKKVKGNAAVPDDADVVVVGD